MSRALFSGDVSNLTVKEIEQVFKDAPIESMNEDMNIVDMLVDKKVCSSKREAREFISSGTISINGNKVTDLEFTISKDIAIEETYIIVRRGKKKYYLFKYN